MMCEFRYPVSPCRETKKLMMSAFIRPMKNPQTSSKTMEARYAAPYCFATAVMLTIALAVEPEVIPPKTPLMTFDS